MIIKTGKLFLVIFTSCIFYMCNLQNAGKNEEPEKPNFIGTWKLVLQKIPGLITTTMELKLVINTDETYSLEVIEQAGKTLFTSNGTWNNEVADSITLVGEICKILDTTAEFDTLAILESSVCATPIVLGIPQSTIWSIKTSSLEIPLSALPIDKEQLKVVTTIIQTLPLSKIEE